MTVISDRTVGIFAGNSFEIPEELHVVDGSVKNESLSSEELRRYFDIVGLKNESRRYFDIMGLKNAEKKKVGVYGVFRIMSPKDGDKRVTWSRRVIAEIKAAKKMFLDLLSQGMIPYRVGIDGEASADMMTEFDPLAEEVIFMPMRAIAGG